MESSYPIAQVSRVTHWLAPGTRSWSMSLLEAQNLSPSLLLPVQAASPEFKGYMEQVISNCAHFAKVGPLSRTDGRHVGSLPLPCRLPLPIRFSSCQTSSCKFQHRWPPEP